MCYIAMATGSPTKHQARAHAADTCAHNAGRGGGDREPGAALTVLAGAATDTTAADVGARGARCERTHGLESNLLGFGTTAATLGGAAARAAAGMAVIGVHNSNEATEDTAPVA